MGVLHVVSTPIGNLEDVTLRALRLLGDCELLLAEDTRRVRKLLDRYRIAAKPLSLHAHNEAERLARVLAVLDAGGEVALVSDAGTPLVSDPGERLVCAVLAAGHEVRAVPGPSAVLAALTVAGLPVERFTFVGFLPRKAGARRALIERLARAPETLVFFEAPSRLATTLAVLAERLGERRACVARELTKLHEEVVRGTLAQLAERFAGGVRGEVTIVVAGAEASPPPSLRELDEEILAGLARGESIRDVSQRLARPGLSRKQLYDRALSLRREAGDDPGEGEG